ncbi:hybrid sensor histidine kinase/response regulator [Jannaschia pagri]|uniref:histidine kinase n=1 Tax=Jannaschia pagri TaxID=2829797 RepID=A0ABQ4NJP5_9RHOB|nr:MULTISPECIES: response regulator [unclassified Jannaschia]GIT90809.1 hybrid sensor histidine kinase/response regulator [Jannaschia sp. AI_61]GIT94641.1 hybrid sensor histidine kinase/response regulator [Jannaschia sp. AI_62]
MGRRATTIERYRLAVATALGCLAIFMGAILTYLPSHLSELAVAQGDVTPWSISQLDAEFAKLDAALARRQATGAPSDEALRLRIDIALSRLEIVRAGTFGRLLDGDGDDQAMSDLAAIGNRLVEAADAPGALTEANIRQLTELVAEARPLARDVALQGVAISSERTEQSRDRVLRSLTLTGAIAGVLLVGLAILVILLSRLLRVAQDRDAAVSRSSRRLQSTIEASMDAIVTTDADGRIVAFNSAAERMFGHDRSGVIGRPVLSTLFVAQIPACGIGAAGLAELASRPTTAEALKARRATGEPFPAELKLTQVEARDGAEYIAYIRDMTLQQQAQQRLIDARDRALRTDTAKSRFLAVMSHEMRTPLNGVLGVLDLLRTTDLSATQSRFVDVANASGELLLERVNDALDITRIETESLHLDTAPFDVTRLLTGVAEVLAPLAVEKSLSIDVDIAPDVDGWFMGDAARIRQILVNLGGNAVKFTDEGAVILQATLAPNDPTVLAISVHDTGSGIAPADQERIFDDFVSLAQAQGRQTRGDGLGLAIARRLARQMGGDLTVASTLDLGTSFTLSLALDRAQTAPLVSRTSPEMDTPTRDVLLVEDNEINRTILRAMLTNLGHRVTEACDGLDALDRLAAAPYDLILMDINMPGPNGLSVIRQVRQGDGPNAQSRIVALTAHGQEEFSAKATAAGADGFETKPIRLSTLATLLADIGEAPMPLSRPPEDMHEVIADLAKVLGPAQVHRTITTLSSEIDALIAAKDAGEPITDRAHRAKGAAAMLGAVGLVDLLAEAEQDGSAITSAALLAQRDVDVAAMAASVGPSDPVQP